MEVSSHSSADRFESKRNNKLQEIMPFKNPRMPQYLTAGAVAVGAFNFGNALGWSSTGLESLKSSHLFSSLSSSQISWIASLVTIGAVFGSTVGGFLIGKIGRCRSFSISSIILTVGWIVMAVAMRIEMLYAGRFLTGFGSGMTLLTASFYLTEISHPEIRGRISTTFPVVCGFGVLFTYLVGYFLPYNLHAAICGLVPIIFFVLTWIIPESPWYLIQVGAKDRAVTCLCYLSGSDKKNPPEEIITAISQIEAVLKTKSGLKNSFRDLVSLPMIISVGLMLFNQLSGGNIFRFYTVYIFQEASKAVEGTHCSEVLFDPHSSVVIVGVFQFVATIAGYSCIDRFGRRILLICSLVTMSISVSTLAVFFMESLGLFQICHVVAWLPLICLVLYSSAYCFGVSGLAYIIMSEILPTNIVGTGSTIATSFSWILAFLTTRYFLDVYGLLGPPITFWTLGGICLAGAIFTFVFVPETARKQLTDFR